MKHLLLSHVSHVSSAQKPHVAGGGRCTGWCPERASLPSIISPERSLPGCLREMGVLVHISTEHMNVGNSGTGMGVCGQLQEPEEGPSPAPSSSHRVPGRGHCQLWGATRAPPLPRAQPCILVDSFLPLYLLSSYYRLGIV